MKAKEYSGQTKKQTIGQKEKNKIGRTCQIYSENDFI
jgi:hypothetical protein